MNNQNNNISDIPQKPQEVGRVSQSPLRQIRKFCLDCASGPKSVRFCKDPSCALWHLRFGRKPKSVMRLEGTDARCYFDPVWILERADEVD